VRLIEPSLCELNPALGDALGHWYGALNLSKDASNVLTQYGHITPLHLLNERPKSC